MSATKLQKSCSTHDAAGYGLMVLFVCRIFIWCNALEQRQRTQLEEHYLHNGHVTCRRVF